MPEAIRYERLERVTWERREWHPVGETQAEMAACMEWVRSLGHEAKSLEDDGFRYRSVYRGAESPYITKRNDEGVQCSGWLWASPGEWLMHIVGENQDSEIDSPHDSPPDDSDDWGLPRGGWQQVSAATDSRGAEWDALSDVGIDPWDSTATPEHPDTLPNERSDQA